VQANPLSFTWKGLSRMWNPPTEATSGSFRRGFMKGIAKRMPTSPMWAERRPTSHSHDALAEVSN